MSKHEEVKAVRQETAEVLALAEGLKEARRRMREANKKAKEAGQVLELSPHVDYRRASVVYRWFYTRAQHAKRAEMRAKNVILRRGLGIVEQVRALGVAV